MENNLPDLRDIHLPEHGISIWPLAHGWWLIIALIVLTVFLFWLITFLRRKSKKRYALKLIGSLRDNNLNSIIKMSEILRRICVYKYPQATSLFGQQWIDFLNLRSSQKIDDSTAQILIDAPYVKPDSRAFSPDKVAKLRDFCTFWIGENL